VGVDPSFFWPRSFLAEIFFGFTATTLLAYSAVAAAGQPAGVTHQARAAAPAIDGTSRARKSNSVRRVCRQWFVKQVMVRQPDLLKAGDTRGERRCRGWPCPISSPSAC
jgi:hypothetical protein